MVEGEGKGPDFEEVRRDSSLIPRLGRSGLYGYVAWLLEKRDVGGLEEARKSGAISLGYVMEHLVYRIYNKHSPQLLSWVLTKFDYSGRAAERFLDYYPYPTTEEIAVLAEKLPLTFLGHRVLVSRLEGALEKAFQRHLHLLPNADLNETTVDPTRYPLFHAYRALAFPIKVIAAYRGIGPEEVKAIEEKERTRGGLPYRLALKNEELQRWLQKMVSNAIDPQPKAWMGKEELSYYEELLSTTCWLLDGFQQKYRKSRDFPEAFPDWVRASVKWHDLLEVKEVKEWMHEGELVRFLHVAPQALSRLGDKSGLRAGHPSKISKRRRTFGPALRRGLVCRGANSFLRFFLGQKMAEEEKNARFESVREDPGLLPDTDKIARYQHAKWLVEQGKRPAEKRRERS